jgi:GMP synthase (glutamine-hydrolysing)
MVRIFVIDNGGQWTHREWRTLRDLDVDTCIVPNTTPLRDLQKEGIHGLVLSGGAPRIGLNSVLGNCAEYLDKAAIPILGICAGHQFMARHFGGSVKPSEAPEFGQVELTLCTDNDILFKGVPKKSIVWESHNDEVVALPKDFLKLAESENCPIQAMRHNKKQMYGLQFHPEVEHTQYGEQIFQNFISLCKQ